MRKGKCKISTCGGCVWTRKIRHRHQLVCPFKNKLSDQSSGLKEAVGGHVMGWVSTCPPISLDTALAFATPPVDETGALAISSASSGAPPSV